MAFFCNPLRLKNGIRCEARIVSTASQYLSSEPTAGNGGSGWKGEGRGKEREGEGEGRELHGQGATCPADLLADSAQVQVRTDLVPDPLAVRHKEKLSR